MNYLLRIIMDTAVVLRFCTAAVELEQKQQRKP